MNAAPPELPGAEALREAAGFTDAHAARLSALPAAVAAAAPDDAAAWLDPLGQRRAAGAAAAELERGLAHSAADSARAERAFAIGRSIAALGPGPVAAAGAQRTALLVDRALVGADPDQRALVDALIRSAGADLGGLLEGAARARRVGVRARVHALSGGLAEVSSAMTMHGGSLESTLE